MEQGTHEQNNITVEMEITLSTAPEQIREVKGIGNDDDDNDADFVPGCFRGSLKEFCRINVILPIINSTRPDTRPPVADGWAGAEMRVFTLFDSCSLTDRPTDGRTDGQSLL